MESYGRMVHSGYKNIIIHVNVLIIVFVLFKNYNCTKNKILQSDDLFIEVVRQTLNKCYSLP